MNWAKRIAALVLAVAVALTGVAYLLPRQASVARAIEIAAPPSAVFPLIVDLRRFGEWSPWFDHDPDIAVTFTGPIEGVGQTVVWQSDQADIGSGELAITRIESGAEVEIALDFGAEGQATAWLRLETAGAATTVTWTFATDLGLNPIARYSGLWIDGMVGPDFEQGLAKLKALVEASAAPG